jgi:outer membrane protein insertion porin family
MKKILFTVLLGVFALSSVAQIRYGVRSDQQKPVETNVIDLSYTNPKIYEIAGIGVNGAETLDSIALISVSGLSVGDKVRIPGEDLSNAVKKLWSQGIIEDVGIYVTKVELDRVWIVIDVVERGRVNRVLFEGLNKTQEGEIMEKISVRGKVLTSSLIKNTEIAIKKYLDDKGYLNATVRTEQLRDSITANRLSVKFIVDRKGKVGVDRIYFEGNEEFDDKRLKSKMKNTGERVRFHLPRLIVEGIASLNGQKIQSLITEREETSFKDLKAFVNDNVKLNFFKAAKFVNSKFDEDKESIIAYYNSKGYRDADILTDSVYRSSDNSLSIKIRIEEGNQYYIRNINWVGNYIHDDETLNKILSIEKGDIYNKDLLNRKLQFDPQQQDVSSLYMNDGYLFFQVDPAEIKVEGDSIDLEIRVREGTQATINNVIVSGNERTNDHVIFRELWTRPGEKFSRQEIIRTQRELSQLGYFDPTAVNPRPIPNMNDGTVDILWELEETPSDQIELSGGWGGVFGFVGTVGLRFNNFSLRNVPNFERWRPLPVGDGQSFGIRAQANGRRFQSYSINFVEPWIGGKKPNSLSVSLSKSIQRNIDFFTNETFGAFKVTGATVSLGRRVKWPDNYFQISNSLSYLLYDVNNFGSTLGFSTGLANNITFNNIIARNSVNDPMFPSFGSNVMLTTTLTPPYSAFNNTDYESLEPENRYKWVEYHKWMFDASFFVPLPAKFVVMAKTNLGFIGGYNGRTGFSPFERFILGGSGLAGQQGFILAQEIIALRGYEDNAIQPIDAQTGFRGGVAYNKYTMELRYPVSRNPTANIFLLGFVEGGNTFNNYQEYNPFKLYRSAGMGARVFMPAFGLLGVDWGYGFDTLPGQREKSGPQIHFVIGQQFR